MSNLREELAEINQQVEKLEARKAAIYAESLKRPDAEKVCPDGLAEMLTEPLAEMKFPIKVHGIAWEGEHWEKTSHRKIQPGDMAAVRVAGEEQTHLGVYIGELVIHESASLDPQSGVLRIRKFGGNPTLWVPALKRVVQGSESWWGKIDSPEQLRAITDKDIHGIWYVRLMQTMLAEPPTGEPPVRIEGVTHVTHVTHVTQYPPTPEQLEAMKTRRQKLIDLHRLFNHLVGEKPAKPSTEELRLRVELVLEETLELVIAVFGVNDQFTHAVKLLLQFVRTAPVQFNMKLTADAAADVLVTAEGLLVALGIDSGPLFDEVHRSNMSKGGGPVREDGKRLKGPNYSPPDIAGVLRKQGWVEE